MVVNDSFFDLERKNIWLYFGVIVLSSILLSFAFNFLIINDDLYYVYFQSKLSYERIEELLYSKERWSWLSYALVPVYFFLKFGIITITLLTGLFIFNIRIEIKKIFKIVIVSEVVFLFPLLIKILWFSFIKTDYTLEDIQFFSAASLLNFFRPQELESWWIYPLKIINIFEVLYWLVLSSFLVKITKETFDRMLVLVLSSYGISLLLWVIFVTFLTVSVGG